ISVEEDQDYDIEDIARLPFRIAKVLGGGHSAIVEKVHDTKTGKIFAKKTIRFPQARLKKQKEEHFKNEVNIIRSLKNHHHIIRIFATYVAKREFGLILQPAADEGSLEDYLGNYWDKLEQPGPAKEDVDLVVPVLEKAFGCLASGLAYIHGKGVRHKDIKPQNILVHRGSILYTDFGSSKDANQPGESTTEGLPDFLTRKYSPPEVLAHTKRNYGADIYSLGCVYVELIKALIPNINYDEGRWFSDIMEHVHQELSSAVIPSRWSFIPTIIRAMTRTDREQR
ncbi:kinase-like domain-containing protein, partial [Phaeosphaeriaceae sp. PMI808]